MGNPFDPLNLILFLIAVVGFIRLRMILGRRTGNEDPIKQNKYSRSITKDIKTMAEAKQKSTPKSKDESILFLQSTFPGFSEKSFLEGASNAYEMILKNYADGNLNAIKKIISKEVYEGFSVAVKERNNKNTKLVNELIAFDKADIINIEIEKKEALITVEFFSRIITYVTNVDDEVLEGNKDNPISIIDQWTFEKPLRDKTLSWKLVSTQSQD